MYTG
jgi:uncharacterized membrane protein YgcG